jgi:hypothetical protein
MFSKTFGEWREQNQFGVYRLVVLESKEKFLHNLVFLQWISKPVVAGSDNAGSVVVSVPVREINMTANYTLSDPKVGGVAGAVGGIAEITGVNNFTRKVQGIRLQPKMLGEYSITFINAPTERSQAIFKQIEDAVFGLPVK